MYNKNTAKITTAICNVTWKCHNFLFMFTNTPLGVFLCWAKHRPSDWRIVTTSPKVSTSHCHGWNFPRNARARFWVFWREIYDAERIWRENRITHGPVIVMFHILSFLIIIRTLTGRVFRFEVFLGRLLISSLFFEEKYLPKLSGEGFSKWSDAKHFLPFYIHLLNCTVRNNEN